MLTLSQVGLRADGGQVGPAPDVGQDGGGARRTDVKWIMFSIMYLYEYDTRPSCPLSAGVQVSPLALVREAAALVGIVRLLQTVDVSRFLE